MLCSAEAFSDFLMLLAQLPGGSQALVKQPVCHKLANILHHGSDQSKVGRPSLLAQLLATLLAACDDCLHVQLIQLVFHNLLV